MSTAKIGISIEESLLKKLDRLVKIQTFPSRSKAIQLAVVEKLSRMDRGRLSRECAKLDPTSERKLAEEGMEMELSEWPEY